MADPTPVAAADPSKTTSKILEETDEETTIQMQEENAKCLWNDQEFAQGSQVSTDGSCYICNFGRWVKIS